MIGSTLQPVAVLASEDGFAPVTQPLAAGAGRRLTNRRAPSNAELRQWLRGYGQSGNTRARAAFAELLDWREGRLPRRDIVSDDDSYREAIEALGA